MIHPRDPPSRWTPRAGAIARPDPPRAPCHPDRHGPTASTPCSGPRRSCQPDCGPRRNPRREGGAAPREPPRRARARPPVGGPRSKSRQTRRSRCTRTPPSPGGATAPLRRSPDAPRPGWRPVLPRSRRSAGGGRSRRPRRSRRAATRGGPRPRAGCLPARPRRHPRRCAPPGPRTAPLGPRELSRPTGPGDPRRAPDRRSDLTLARPHCHRGERARPRLRATSRPSRRSGPPLPGRLARGGSRRCSSSATLPPRSRRSARVGSTR